MKSSKQEETVSDNISRLINRLIMASGFSHGSFERVKLKGTNIGAAMINSRGSSGESSEASESCSINIYINNNVQGVNNSVVVGSEVNMGDPGVWLSLKGAKLDRGSVRPKKRINDSGLGFLGMFMCYVASHSFGAIPE
ncbi:hypothetical protein LguiB_030758 [Lonicera macranthoides]